MNEPISRSLVVLGASILLGFIALGWLLGNAAVRVKKFGPPTAVSVDSASIELRGRRA